MNRRVNHAVTRFFARLSVCTLLAPVAYGQQNVPVLTTESNLVLVRVVVRDSQGKTITGLKKEDFKLFDRGREQTISNFEELPAALSSSASQSSTPQTPAPAPGTPTSPAPFRLVAFYFDDLNATAASLMRSRDAADAFLKTNLQPGDKVAIFSSDKLLTDFTSDTAKIHEALARLNPSTHAKSSVRLCPDLSEYQAEQILSTRYNNVDPRHQDPAWQLAADEIKQCSGSNGESLTGFQVQQITSMATHLVNDAQTRTRTTLEQLEQVAKLMAHLPGELTLLLVSPGFLSQQEQYRLDSVIDRALHAQVVINVLDPKGLAVMMREQDPSRQPAANTELSMIAATTLDSHQAVVSGDVLTELSQGTGGRLFHNDNDLGAGFNSLAGHPDEYSFTFSPGDLKRDGKFHELKVTLANKQKGVTLSARKGYFAGETAPASAPVQATVITPVTPHTPTAPSGAQASASPQTPQIGDTLKDAILATSDSTDLPIEVEVEQAVAGIEVRMHLDAKAIPFRKDGDHSVDTVTFAAAIFDSGDKAGEIKQRSARLNLTADQLAGITNNGINLVFNFPAETGAHRVRAVVTESEQHKVGSVSKTLGAH